MITREDCITALQAFIEREGRAPTYTEWSSQCMKPSGATILRRFDGWCDAVTVAGATAFEPGKPKTAQTKEIVERLSMGERLMDLAAEFDVSVGALSQRVTRYCARTGTHRPVLGGSGTAADREEAQMNDPTRGIG